jgi:hypothetical protein
MEIPKYPVGSRVVSHLFFDPDEPKVVHSTIWDGTEFAYTLIDDAGVLDEGYFANHLQGANT